MRIAHSLFLLSGLLFIGQQSAWAQTPPPACVSAEYRQFDFWLGEWEVEGGLDGKTPVGKSTITRIAKGCALHENWRSANGGDGQSLNVYDSVTKQWTQFWIGADGVILRLAGGLNDGAMVLQGDLQIPSGKTQMQRITWTSMKDGRVSQRWDTSDDQGKSWQISFLGFYKKAVTGSKN